MPDSKLVFQGRQGSEARAGTPLDCIVDATFSGDRFLDSQANVHLNTNLVLKMPLNLFHQFCNFAKGKPSRQWSGIFAEPSFNNAESGLPDQLNTVEQNILKACFLVYLWVEPLVVSGKSGELKSTLLDELIVDYSGNLGNQPFLYFPPKEYQEPHDDAFDKLYELQLLCRMTATISGNTIRRYFTPLVAPAVLIDRFGTTAAERQANYLVWLGIRSRIRAQLELLTRKGE